MPWQVLTPGTARALLVRRGSPAGDLAAYLSALVQLRRCTSVGAWPRVWGRISIENYGRIVIGERLRVRGKPWASELATTGDGTLVIGNGTYINSGTSISARSSVTIGSRCHIGPRVLIMDSDYHIPGDPLGHAGARPVVLEDEVWVGAAAIILKGVHIGSHASIGAGSVVTKDVPAGTVVGGVPARPIRELTAKPD